jgi:hypothetical protein
MYRSTSSWKQSHPLTLSWSFIADEPMFLKMQPPVLSLSHLFCTFKRSST